MAELFCCSPKATITALIGYTPIRNKLMSLSGKKKKPTLRPWDVPVEELCPDQPC